MLLHYPLFYFCIMNKAVLVLEDGKEFWGNSIGVIGSTTGEICFNTGMTGYQEIYTDPSYYGQIMINASVHIGNYGTKESENESDSIKIAGLVVKNFSNHTSRYGDIGSLQDFLEKDNIVGISNIDTRALVRYIRNKGAMNAIISSEEFDTSILLKKVKATPSMEGMELSSKVSTQKSYTSGDENAEIRVAVLDFGVKRNIIRCLNERDAFVKVFPMNTSINELMEFKPDGFMLSNGPGDPSVMLNSIDLVNEITQLGIPVFGICLGHQILALSQGLKTIKMHNGHRGINHPVKNLINGKCEVTSQNHGFVVDIKSLENRDDIELTHLHLNDNTVAGIKLKNKSVFSVQYHPESSPGPEDSRYLFDQFIENIKKRKLERV
jgi:carbamoyl-phosphate synthase small subunit